MRTRTRIRQYQIFFFFCPCFVCKYRFQQKYLSIMQHSCEWNRSRGEFVLERSSSETRSISVAMERWSVEHRAFVVETYLKNSDSVLTQRIFRRHFNIHRNDSVPSRNTSSSENISSARCTERNQGQRWIWNRTSGKKWQQFLPTCYNEWCRTSRNAWGNVLTTGSPPHRHYIQEVNVVIKMFWVKDTFGNKSA
jgi:hypothetical protein